MTTRGGLQPAVISEIGGGNPVPCMFNPFEYKVTKSNTYTEDPKNSSDTPHAEFSKSGPQVLTLDLIFDTYESEQDVSLETNKLWKLMRPNKKNPKGKSKKLEPPEVVFEWGVFRFEAFITNMTQTFTLFTMTGTPVRAKVSVTFTQYKDKNNYPAQNPTSGGGDIERVWRVVSGDRLDAIAYEVYGDVNNWRLIAERNKIRDPLGLRPGQTLLIPSKGE